MESVSRDCWIYAERRRSGRWELLGEIRTLPRDGSLWPSTVLEVAPESELLEVLNGISYDFQPPFHAGLERVKYRSGLPDDISEELGTYLRQWLGREAHWLVCLGADDILSFDWHSPNILLSAFVREDQAELFSTGEAVRRFPLEAWCGSKVSSSRRLPYCATEEAVAQALASGWSEDQILYTWHWPGTKEVYWSECHYRFVGQPDEFFEELRALGPPEDVRLFIWVE